MTTIFLLTRIERGPAGHGEPGDPFLTLATIRVDGYGFGAPHPAFTDREVAEKYSKDNKLEAWYDIQEVYLI